jgi:MFS family permease
MSSAPALAPSITESAAALAATRDPYAALRHPGYRAFVLGRAVFMVGSQMQTAAVAWFLYEKLGSVLALGYVGLVQIIPIILLALPAGHVADRVDRRKLIAAGQSVFLLCSLGLAAISWWNGPAVFIYALLFVLAAARIFITPAMGALRPGVVPRHLWGNAATWNSSLFELTGMVGPALAGFAIAVAGGATAVFVLAAFCSATALTLFLRLRVTQTISPKKAATVRDVLGGLRFLFSTRLLLAAAALDLFAVLLGSATALLPVVAKDILHVGPAGFGWLRAAPSIGAVAMALLTVHLPPWKRAGRVLLFAFVGYGLSIIVFGLSTHFALSFAMLVLTGVFDNLNVVIRQTLMQYITPDEMRGRVMAVNFIFIGSSNELGALESGVAARFLGPAAAIVAGGVGAIAVTLSVARLAPGLRNLGRLHEIRPAAVV